VHVAALSPPPRLDVAVAAIRVAVATLP
jgi:hypothetical protein